MMISKVVTTVGGDGDQAETEKKHHDPVCLTYDVKKDIFHDDSLCDFKINSLTLSWWPSDKFR